MYEWHSYPAVTALSEMVKGRPVIKDNFRDIEWDVVISWNLRGLHGFKESTWLLQVQRLALYHEYANKCLS